MVDGETGHVHHDGGGLRVVVAAGRAHQRQRLAGRGLRLLEAALAAQRVRDVVPRRRDQVMRLEVGHLRVDVEPFAIERLGAFVVAAQVEHLREVGEAGPEIRMIAREHLARDRHVFTG